MTKKYYIKFITGKEFIGTAKEIVTQLRNESKSIAQSYKMSIVLKLFNLSYDIFMKYFGGSVKTIQLEELE